MATAKQKPNRRIKIERYIKMQEEIKDAGDAALYSYARTAKLEEDDEKIIKEMLSTRKAKLIAFRKICMHHCYGSENGWPNDYKTGTKCGNIIGDRIRFILEQHKITVTQLAQKSGVGRSSLQRFLSENNADVPKLSTLDKIIQTLPCGLDDFIVFEEDFETWREMFSGATAMMLEEQYFKYEDFKNEMMENFYKTIVYSDNGKNYRMPMPVADVFIKQMMAVFSSVDTLLEYEKKMSKPQIFFNLPVEEKEPVEVKVVRGKTIIIDEKSVAAAKQKQINHKQRASAKASKQKKEST